MSINDPFHNDIEDNLKNYKVPKVIKAVESHDVLEAKLAEYIARMNSPEASPRKKLDSEYKKTLLEHLLQDGEARPYEVARELKIDSKTSLLFINACKVIQDYVLTGGKHILGGTGLPVTEEPDPDIKI